MDKTLEIVVVAMIVLVTGLVMLFLVQGESEGFQSFLDGQTDDADCKVAESQAQMACPDEKAVKSILEENQDQCSNIETTDCQVFCDREDECNPE